MREQPQEPGKALDRAILTILTAARALIAKPENWTQGCAGRTKSGEVRSYHESDVFAFCPMAAIYRAAGVRRSEAGAGDIGSDAPQVRHALARVAARLAGEDEPGPWDHLDPDQLLRMNDLTETTHEDVIAAFDGAITTTKARLRQ